jgi:hypothetical protein
MTVTKRRGKRTDAGRCQTLTFTFVIDVLHILYDTVSSRCNKRKNSMHYMRGVVYSAVLIWLCVKFKRSNYMCILWLSVLCIHAKAFAHTLMSQTNTLFFNYFKSKVPQALDTHAANQGEACE